MQREKRPSDDLECFDLQGLFSVSAGHQTNLRGFSTDILGHAGFQRAIDAGNGDEFGLETGGQDARFGIAIGPGHGPAS